MKYGVCRCLAHPVFRWLSFEYLVHALVSLFFCGVVDDACVGVDARDGRCVAVVCLGPVWQFYAVGVAVDDEVGVECLEDVGSQGHVPWFTLLGRLTCPL